MPAKRTQVVKRYATIEMIVREWEVLPLHLKRRLEAIWFLYDCDSTREVANDVGASQRSVQRWLSTWNSLGPNALLARKKPGPKRKIDREVFRQKLLPLILDFNGEARSNWTITEVQRALAHDSEIKVSRPTLERAFRRFGYPPRPPQRTPSAVAKADIPHDWKHPWRPVYGSSLTDYLNKTGELIPQP